MSVKAAIDIGTNSVRLLVADCQAGRIVPLVKELRTTRLGQGVHHSGRLQPDAIERTLAAIDALAAIAKQGQADEIVAVATSAVRDAANGPEFIQLCRARTGLTVQILSGTEEARLSFSGALQGRTAGSRQLVIDIGGGSTELAFGGDTGLQYVYSLNVGAVRLKDIFPADVNGIIMNIPEIQRYATAAIKALPPLVLPDAIIGVGGTITSLAAIAQQLTAYDSEKVHGYYLDTACVNGLLAALAALTLAERKKTAGLQPERADIIVYGIAILAALLDELGSNGLTVSERDILEGILEQLSAKQII